MLGGEKFAVKPEGWPLTDRFTAVLKVEEIVVETVTVALFPTKIVVEPDDAVMVNVAGTFTTRFTMPDLVVPPDDPVTVSRYVPATTFIAALNVRMVEPDPGAANMLGLKLAVTPGGRPARDNVTAELNPLLTLTLMLAFVLLAAAKFTVAGALTINVGGGGALPSLQCVTSMFASTDPNPLLWS